MAELVDLAGLDLHRAFHRDRALGDHDDREIGAALVAALDAIADLFDVERLLGHQDHVGAARETGVRRDPTRVTPHHLHDHDPVVALRGRVQAVDGVGGDLHRGVEPEGEVGGRQVVVDRLRHAHHLHAVAREPVRHTERVLAADRDHRADTVAGERRLHPLGTVVGVVRVGARRAENGAAAREEPARRLERQGHRLTLDQPAPTVPVTDELVPLLVALADDGPDHRVEAGAVTPAREHADTHRTPKPEVSCPILRRAAAERSDAEVSRPAEDLSMDNEAPLSTDNDEADAAGSEESEADATAAIEAPDPTETAAIEAPDDARPDTDAQPDSTALNPHEERLRKLAGRVAPYAGPIFAITRGWVSRDSSPHVFAARYLDFAVLTEEHLMFCSTGFFSRKPRRRVFLEPYKQLVIVPRGSEPFRTLRIVGDFASPLLLELKDDANSLAFARELIERVHRGQEP